MQTQWTAVVEIVIGVIFCFFGFPFARFVLALWGAALGFFWGTAGFAVVAHYLGAGVGSIAPWIFGLIGAVVLAGLAFAFYSVAVLVAMGTLGWGLGQLLATSLQVPVWLSVTIAVVVAAGLVVLGVSFDLPRLLLVLLTAFAGAGGIIDAVLQLMGQNPRWYDGLVANPAEWTQWLWPAAVLVLAVLGALFQSRQQAGTTLRAAYRK